MKKNVQALENNKATTPKGWKPSDLAARKVASPRSAKLMAMLEAAHGELFAAGDLPFSRATLQRFRAAHPDWCILYQDGSRGGQWPLYFGTPKAVAELRKIDPDRCQ